MRTIKFRGKTDNRSNSWAYGSLLIDETYNNVRIYNMETGWFDFVHPETVGQFVGMSDRSGKEIYEGDVILHLRTKLLGRLTWSDDHSGFLPNWKFDETLMFWFNKHEVEIIGNVHDNPELLK